MKERNSNLLLTLLGVALVAVGFFLLRGYGAAQGLMAVLPFLAIGLGCGTFGHGMGALLSRKALAADPALQKQLEIDQQDERNQAIANLAKGKAFDKMIFVFGALMVSFALMGVDLVPLLLLVFAYLLVVGYSVYYRVRLEKEM
ncbi:MAG: hypothetical protein MR419_06510 [Clostridiales bacterium]|nr:hypothetical protein [Clostridiales bacterium]MDY4171281.1 hypothetical protein [Evtepia sp.]